MSLTIYVKNNCPQCKMTLVVMRQLQIQPDTTINISEHPEAIESLKQAGWKATPVVVTDTDSWSGFRPDKIKQLVDQVPKHNFAI